MASPDGYSWQNGEVVTATKLNEASLPPIAAETSSITLGQDSTHSVVLEWTYNATASNATAKLTTFGQSNDLYIQGKSVYIDSASLPFAVQVVDSGRVRIGGGADDGAAAFQVNGSAAINPAGAVANLTLGTGGASSFSTITMRGNTSQIAWQIASNNFASDVLQFTPSTAAGGTTFTTPVATLSASGLALTGTITTAAGAAWNLGAANVVSPTSPNRTLTVVIGGTTYYVAAKTTND